jgi:hypothetical protein
MWEAELGGLGRVGEHFALRSEPGGCKYSLGSLFKILNCSSVRGNHAPTNLTLNRECPLLRGMTLPSSWSPALALLCHAPFHNMSPHLISGTCSRSWAD